jgi:hypothetical protein
MSLETFHKEINVIAPWFDYNSNKNFILMRDLFPENLYKMSELSIAPFSESLGIMFQGKDEKYISDLMKFMTETGIKKKQIKHFNHFGKLFPDVNILVKADFSKEGKTKLSYYHHILTSKQNAVNIMKELRINKNSIIYFLDVISFLLRKDELYVGFNFRPDGGVITKIFFCNRIDKSGSALCPAIASIMAKLNLSSRLISFFIDFHNYLAAVPHRSVFTSVIFTDKLEEIIKIDYEGIPLEKIVEIYKSVKIPQEEIEKLENQCKELNINTISYFGIKYINEKPPVFKCYFTRRYGLEDDPSKLAELIGETRWVNEK